MAQWSHAGARFGRRNRAIAHARSRAIACAKGWHPPRTRWSAPSLSRGVSLPAQQRRSSAFQRETGGRRPPHPGVIHSPFTRVIHRSVTLWRRGRPVSASPRVDPSLLSQEWYPGVPRWRIIQGLWFTSRQRTPEASERRARSRPTGSEHWSRGPSTRGGDRSERRVRRATR
jgi:hypothetical protein